jgi:hypothetical protein
MSPSGSSAPSRTRELTLNQIEPSEPRDGPPLGPPMNKLSDRAPSTGAGSFSLSGLSRQLEPGVDHGGQPGGRSRVGAAAQHRLVAEEERLDVGALHGLPLAIELAASSIRVLSPRDLLASAGLPCSAATQPKRSRE